MKLSDAQKRVLSNLDQGRPAHWHCKTNSHWGGLVSTLRFLDKQGLIDSACQITARGREALARANARPGTSAH